MYVIKSQSADEALYKGMMQLCDPLKTVTSSSRNGPVLRFDAPLASVYNHPRQRVLFNPIRENNPFFSLFESLWMLAGRNDLAFVNRFVGQMAAYSDDGVTLNGAYGHRWRKHFGVDQLEFIIKELTKSPDSRRAHLQMWDAAHDTKLLMTTGSLDVPCNLSAEFEIQDEKLNMTVYNRSNDLIWGAYGANIVHFSFLQEYVACALGVEIGTYTQVSNNAHVYIENPVAKKILSIDSDGDGDLTNSYTKAHNDVENYYQSRVVAASPPLFTNGDWRGFDEINNYFFDYFDCNGRLMDIVTITGNSFFDDVAFPMAAAFELYKNNRLEDAAALLHKHNTESDISYPYDWLLNAEQWINRRISNRNAKNV